VMAGLLGLLPVLVSALALARAADDWRPAGAVAALATILTLVGPRWELDRGRQLVTSAMGAGAGYALVALLYDPHAGSLGEGWTRFAAAMMLASAARSLIVRPRGGRTVTTALLFAGVLAIGETHVSGYVGFVAAFLLTSLCAPATGDESSLLTETTARRLVAGAAIALVGGAIALGVAIGLRSAYAWIANRHAQSTAFLWRPRVGFSDRMDLGALDGLLDSDTVVLRVRGPRVDYLRGAALDVYVAGRWIRSDRAEIETEASYDGEPSSGDRVEIAAVSEHTDRFFLPLETRLLVTSPTAVLVDDVGAVKRTAKHGINVARFVTGERDRASPAPPGPSDVQLPRGIRLRLARLAEEWTHGANDSTEKLDAIERTLRKDYRYAQAFQNAGTSDPALDFLLVGKKGHCEYFATGMALIARAAGIPARVIMGYRVGEQSPFGYYVVRERNAHAWVEAWLPGRGWTTRDPTPETDLPQNREHIASYAASAADALRIGYDDLTDWLRRLSVRQTTIAWVVGFAVLLWIVARGARRRGVATSRLPADETALPCLAILLSTLKRAGHVYPFHEPIERLAVRIPDPDAARLLRRYAALRYGDVGDERALAEDVLTYAGPLRGRKR
jgi:transglutaminase-like putative cysteine protease